MILRIILYTFIAYLAMRVIRWLFTPSRSRPRPVARGRRSSPMVRCEACGMFITKSSALMAGDRDFCSKKCLEQKVDTA